LAKLDVWLPDALAVKYPNASHEWGWQIVYGAKTAQLIHAVKLSVVFMSGKQGQW